ncbi:toxin-antitoxin system TumE family protein [Desulfonema magnum]|uniref:Uncharacterized protein n=1 Tax=Desulfonema magnum TaxID=45655 RepID=A0A975BVL4_9BACT|nr:DUF6516 family protein [Desulfonema magnum]QTA92312.1 Uncharacterized protein dnm_083900 [Desulfonema magnum]
MESITGYFSQFSDITNKNNWIICQNISFRQISEKEAYVRGELHLHGGFILHMAEYVTTDSSGIIKRLKYRYQLQDRNNALIARWDNAPHHSELPTYPFHRHCKDGQTVSSPEMDIPKLLAELDDILKDVL